MNSISNDHRFSRAFTDPRFRPMPTLQKKVKIDKRFKAVLSSKDYGHRLHHDKRGRPIHDLSKKGKHEMERYYQISSDDSSDDDDEEVEDEQEDSQSQEEDDSDPSSPASTKSSQKKKLKEPEHEKKSIKKKKRIDVEDEQSSKKKSPGKVKAVSNKQKKQSKKRSLVEEDEDDSFQEKSTAKRLKKNGDISGKMKSSIKKKAVKIDTDVGKIIPKQSKNVEDEMSDNDDDEDVDDDGEEETSSDSDDSSDEEEEVSGDEEEEKVDTSKFITVMKPSTSVDHSWNELHRKAPLVSDSTHRLAVCNMDWDFVKAQDLFVLFKSFAGEGGGVRSVTIYPSEFGKERIVEDAALGPREMRGGLNVDDEDQTESDEDDDDEEDAQQRRRKKNRKIDSEIMKRKAKEAAKAANEALRGYQLNRLRYYFAVVDCNSVDTADTIYKECDGMEYQLSSIRLDLRYIPDDMTFEDPPKDSFSDEHGLVDFQPNYFLSTALSQGKVNVTWDETEFDRIRNKITNAQRDELEQIVEENRYSDTIAPPESDSDLEDEERPQWLKTALGLDHDEGDSDNYDSKTISEEKRISLYRKVLMDKFVEDEQKGKLKKEKASEVDKELKWTSGLKSAYEDKLKKSEKIKEESQGVIVDKYLERKREKRRNRAKKKADLEKGEEDDSGEEGDDNDMPGIIDDSLRELMESEGHDLSSVKSSKKKKADKKKKKASKEAQDDSEAEREKAELELLLMRDDGEEKKIAKPEKVKEKLSRRQKKKLAMKKSERRKERREGRLTIDVEDERFGAMFTSHHFHLDPNHGQFRKTKNNMKLLDEQIKRMSTKSKNKNSGKGDCEIAEVSEDSRSVSKNLVESLKRKMKK